jgi:hypothetical protein
MKTFSISISYRGAPAGVVYYRAESEESARLSLENQGYTVFFVLSN